MNAVVSINQQGVGLYTVGSQPDPKRVILSCNGIQNSLEDAKEMGSRISEKFGGREVLVIYNPTTLSEYFKPVLRRKQEVELSKELALEIYYLLFEKELVQIFAHSHGAVLVEKALHGISEMKGLGLKIEVYTFGGATVIPNCLAGKVQNYVFVEDKIAELGDTTSLDSRSFKKKKMISAIIEISKLMRTEGLSQERAIMMKARQETSRNPCLCDALVEKYKKYVERYNIELLPSSEFDYPKAPDFFDDLSALGSHLLENQPFSSYEHIVDQIAEQDLRRMG